MKNLLQNKNLPDPISVREPASIFFVDRLMSDLSMIRNTGHVDFNNEHLDNVRFVKVLSNPAVGEHLTAKFYIDEALSNSVGESSLLRLDPNDE